VATEIRAGTSTWSFNLNDETQGIPRTLAEGITTRIFPGQHVMLSVVDVAPHSAGTPHSHPEEQWGVLLKGECVRVQGGEEIAMKAGDFWCTPGGVMHTVRTGAAGATILDIFSPPREEYRKAGSGFGTS
jgi:quercetin dioxygenase-like cupin family protein